MKKDRRKSAGGFGRLTLAWFGLLGALALTAGGVHLYGSKAQDNDLMVLQISETPERFVQASDTPPLNVMPLPAATLDTPETVSLASVTPEVVVSEQRSDGAKVIDITPSKTLPAAKTITVEETPEPARTYSEEDLKAIANDSAKVIRVADLPSAGSAAANATKTLPKVSGKRPPNTHASLVKKSTNGKLPKVAASGLKSSTYYTRQFDDPANRPRISIIIGGMGLSSKATRKAIHKLPPEISLAFAPYAKNLDQWADQARKAGHEVLLELPMASSSLPVDELGPASLLPSRRLAENDQRLDWLMSRFTGYFAVTNFHGDQLAASPKVTAIMDRLSASGVAFIADNDFGPAPKYESLSKAATDVTLNASTSDLTPRLEDLEDIAKTRGSVLVKIYPSENTLDEILEWSAGLDEQSVVLAPASAMLN